MGVRRRLRGRGTGSRAARAAAARAAAGAGLRAPLPPVAATLPWLAAAAPPLPPTFDNDFNFDFALISTLISRTPEELKIDKEAIRESAAPPPSRPAPAQAFAFSFAGQNPNPGPAPFGRAPKRGTNPADSLYRQARNRSTTRALRRASSAGSMIGWRPRVDAPLLEVVPLAKQGQRDRALTTLADLQKRFADSRWLKDAKALEVEVRQASGQAVSPDAQNDEEIKLLALRGLMQSDPDRAVPMIEKLLAGNSSVKMRENALFVLGQSRSAKAKEIIAGVAKNGNPDLQLRAVRYLGAMGGPENRQLLDEIYRGANDPALKRQILRGLNNASDRARLLSIAKTETSAELRGEAIQQLGAMAPRRSCRSCIRAKRLRRSSDESSRGSSSAARSTS
jgi:hypothetical protein